MAQGSIKLNKSKSTNARKSGGLKPMKLNKHSSAVVKNKSLQKKLWATATQQTEKMLAAKCKSAHGGRLTLLKPPSSKESGSKKK